MPDWDKLEERIERALQKNSFGEDFIFEPRQARNNKRTVADPDRARVTVCGVFTAHYTDDNVNPSAMGTRGLRFTEIGASKPCLEIVAADVPYALLQGDRVTRCKTGAEYEIENPEANGHGILKLKLLEL